LARAREALAGSIDIARIVMSDDWPYTVLRELGRVQLATRLVGGALQPHVIKTIPVSPGSADEQLERVRTHAGLSHSNIVRVADARITENRSQIQIAMEHVDGLDLRQLCRDDTQSQRTLNDAQACYVMIGVLNALEYLRKKNIVHRDVSPDNILISREGEVKLTDFGIASVVGNDPKEPFGKLGYIAPEQARNQACTPSADMFALGAVFQELLEGRPFRTGSRAELTGKARLGTHEPCQRTDIPGEIERVLGRMLALDPNERISPKEAIEELTRFGQVAAHVMAAIVEGRSPRDRAGGRVATEKVIAPPVEIYEVHTTAPQRDDSELAEVSPSPMRPRTLLLITGAVLLAIIAGFLVVREFRGDLATQPQQTCKGDENKQEQEFKRTFESDKQTGQETISRVRSKLDAPGGAWTVSNFEKVRQVQIYFDTAHGSSQIDQGMLNWVEAERVRKFIWMSARHRIVHTLQTGPNIARDCEVPRAVPLTLYAKLPPLRRALFGAPVLSFPEFYNDLLEPVFVLGVHRLRYELVKDGVEDSVLLELTCVRAWKIDEINQILDDVILDLDKLEPHHATCTDPREWSEIELTAKCDKGSPSDCDAQLREIRDLLDIGAPTGKRAAKANVGKELLFGPQER
jgi:serine/threonine protein kinase